MFFRWDWLRPVRTAPIVPPLGPVHPHVLTVDLFEDTLRAAVTDRSFLHYDKDRRWISEKDETVLCGDVVHQPDHTLIPTLTRRGHGTVKVFAYGDRNGVVDEAAELTAKLAAVHDSVNARVVRPLGPETGSARGTRIQLQDFTTCSCPDPDGPVRPVTDWPAAVQETFAPFATAMAADGLAFLHTQMQAGLCGPVLAAAVEDRIAGAIGPMEVRPDAIGCPQLLPQYFAVLPEVRGHGLGRVLWRAAMHWGQSHGAAHQLLRTEVGGPSDRLCQSEGLTSLDEEQLPRAKELATLGGDTSPKQRAELARLWESLSPEARAQLWLAQKNDLMAAGILSPTMPQIAPDAGSGKHGSESPGFDEWATKQKMELLTEGADWKGMTDASRHMAHYLGNSGSPMNLPVDKMMTDVPTFRTYVDDIVRLNQDDWRKHALAEFEKNGGNPVAFPVEAKQPEGFYFTQQADPNWFYAVGGANTNVTGVVTAVPDANGNPKISIDYQANVWDRYNWDEGKGVNVGPLSIPDGEMAKLHRVGLSQEFDMSGSSSVKHYDLGSSEPNDDPLPGPDDSRDGRLNPGREQQQDRTTGRAAERADGR